MTIRVPFFFAISFNLSSSSFFKLAAITISYILKSLLVSSKYSLDDFSMKLPFTSGFNSNKFFRTTSARSLPISSASTKKFVLRSSWDILALSMMVTSPTPLKIKFLRISEERESLFKQRSFDAQINIWPSPQRRV